MSAPRTFSFKSWPAAILALVLAMAGCSVGPNYKVPDAHPPAQFRGHDGSETNSLGDMPWWQLFQDPALQRLIKTALTNNYDLRVAIARVEESRAMLTQARSAYYPQVGYTGTAGVERNALGGSPYVLGTKPGTFQDVAGTVSWEVDFWGRVRRLSEAAKANYLATDEARRNVQITLVSDVAQAYFQLLTLDEEMTIAQDTTNSFAQSLKIFNERLQGGVSSKLETSAAAAALASAAATIPELRRQIAMQENLIRVELGMNPGPIERRPKGLETTSLPIVPPGLPSDLLLRRPDVRQAEELVHAASARIGVAKAAFYPRINLTGLIGEASPELNALSGGTEAAWYLAGAATGPIFQGGLLKAELRQAKAAWDEARFQYQSSVLQAFQEVSDALSSRLNLAEEREEQGKAVAAYQDAVQVANQRYLGGQANYYELLQEQQLLFPAQNALAQTTFNQLLATVQLYKALGGGWGATNSPPANP